MYAINIPTPPEINDQQEQTPTDQSRRTARLITHGSSSRCPLLQKKSLKGLRTRAKRRCDEAQTTVAIIHPVLIKDLQTWT